MISGVDVSGYQGAKGWEGSGRDFAFVKVTQGTSYVNPRWVAQRDTARAAGLVVGYYHFLERGDTVPQADYFLSKIALIPGDVLACDWETDPATETGATNAEKDAWVTYVQNKTGHRVVLYCNKDYWLNRDTTSFAGDGLWIATAGEAAGSPGITAPWLLHQYSTAGGLDHDVARFDSRDAMRAWATGEPVATTITDEDAVKIAKAVLTLDGVILNDVSGTDNPYLSLATIVRNTGIVTRRAEAAAKAQDSVISALASLLSAILAQAQANGAGLSELKLALEAVDLTTLPEEIAAKLAGLQFQVTVTEGS